MTSATSQPQARVSHLRPEKGLAWCTARAGLHLPERNVRCWVNPGNGTRGPSGAARRCHGVAFPDQQERRCSDGSCVQACGACCLCAPLAGGGQGHKPLPHVPPVCTAQSGAFEKEPGVPRWGLGSLVVRVAGCPFPSRAWGQLLCPRRSQMSPPPPRSLRLAIHKGLNRHLWPGHCRASQLLVDSGQL